LGIENNFTVEIAKVVIAMYKDFYKELAEKEKTILNELEKEENKFRKTLENGMKQFERAVSEVWSEKHLPWEEENMLVGQNENKTLPGKVIFDLYATYGFPIELTEEIAREKNIKLDKDGFDFELKKHQELSKTASAGMFKGGLSDSSEETKKLHTAAHLMLAALRQVLGNHVFQKGSNITPERLRFDFSHSEKMTPEQIENVEDLVNAAIAANMDVVREEMTIEEARKKNVMGVFDAKYGKIVSVYSIGDDNARLVSREICGGPHVQKTGELGHFKIQKEESSSAGVRRIKAVLEK
jgi:alanyl-tRNA synthetase